MTEPRAFTGVAGGHGAASGVVVFGATGELGRRVVRLLCDGGMDVRAATRDPVARQALIPDAAKAIAADLRDRDSLARACAGMGSVVSTANGFMGEGPDAPTLVDQAGHASLIDVAREAGIAHFVFVSATTARADSPIDFFRCKAATEERLVCSGLGYTIIRATAFAETYIALAHVALAGGPPFPMVGRGNNPINCIAIDDVACYVVLALREPKLRNRTLTIGGPENVTLADFLRRIEAAAGRPVPTQRIPLPVARAVAALAAPFKPVIARMIRLGVLVATSDQRFAMAPVSAEFGLPVTPLQQAIVRALR